MHALNPPNSRKYRGQFILCIAVALATGGCDGGSDNPFGKFAPVSGKVTYDGAPVTEGRIYFNSDKGFGAGADLGADGGYVLKSPQGEGVPIGKYKVTILPITKQVADPNDATKMFDVAADPENIPQKYRNESTSGLTAEVKEGPNTFDFDMKK